MNEVLLPVTSILYVVSMLLFLKKVSRKTKNWPIFLFFEYFFIFGLGLSGLYYFFQGGVIYNDKYFSYGGLNVLTAFHILAYLLGAILGYKIFFRQDRYLWRFALMAKKILLADVEAIFYMLIGLSILSSLLYIYILGFDLVLISASAARSGNFDLIEGYSQYRFLNRLSLAGLFAVALIPYFLVSKRRIKTAMLLAFAASILFYLITVSRFSLVFGVFLPTALYWVYYGKRKLTYNLFMLSMVCAAIFILFFGKKISFSLGMAFYGSDSQVLLDRVNSSVDFVTVFLGHFNHLILSINAGIEYFFEYGLVFFTDILLAPFSIVPSSVLQAFGLEALTYQFLPDTERFACVNTANIFPGSDQCFTPPYFTGSSAYTFPIVGGFLFGFIRFHIYRVGVEAMARGNADFAATVILLLFFLDQIYLFIPNTISIVTFTILLLAFFSFLILFARKCLVR